jgi:hypothetical protein
MELASNFLLANEIKQTMEILPGNLSKAEMSKSLGPIKQPPKEFNSMLKRYLEEQRGSLFDGYYENHRTSELLSCRSAEGVEVLFCPSDHSGVWAGLIVKGSLGEQTQQTLEAFPKGRC